jgi:tetratricopeptide (TPR) repeat protein
MSGKAARKGLLKTTVALTAAGTMALAPMAPTAAQDAALEPVAVRVGANQGFTRVEFAGVIGSRARIRREGRAVIIRVGSTAAPDVARLRVDPPPGVGRVETRAVDGGTEVVIHLIEGAQAITGRADGAVYVNLYAPGQGPAAASSPAVPVSGVVPVAVQTSAERLSLTFQWAAPVGAAVFRRGEAVWIVFDAAARLDLDQAARDLGPATGVRWAAGPDYVVARIAAPEGLAVSADSSGAAWTVNVGGPAGGHTGVLLNRDVDSGPTALVAELAGARRAIWLTDPLVGDRFAAVTALAPAKGMGSRRRLVDLTLLPTAQGLGVETTADDLDVAVQGDLVRITRPSGLSLSPPTDALEQAQAAMGAPRRAAYPALILPQWGDTGEGDFAARRRQLQAAAAREAADAEDSPRAPVEARLALARFLAGSGLYYETIGALNALVADVPAMAGEPEVRGLRGASRAAIGRQTEALADFTGSALTGDPSADVWRGYIAVEQSDWATARQAFARGARAIDQFPPVWRARFGTAHALAALETRDLPAARSLLAYVFSQDAPAADQLAARLVQARLFELDGQTDRALAVYRAVGRAPLDGVSTPARLALVRLELASGALTPQEATVRLEPLRWRWRGDATELAVIRSLGEIYLSQGRYREALNALRGAGTRFSRLPQSAELQQDLSQAFRSLFLEGAADGLQPVQALALFYDFRELTPVGADGDDMVRRLARRLIDVDLLGPAAELLQHQVDNRLEGVAQAQIATDLAAVYLMNRQPEQALRAIWATRTTLLPNALNAERRAMEARALMELGRFDHALEIIGSDQSAAAREVKADLYWRRLDYGEAAALYETLLGERWREADAPLTAAEETRLIRAGVGYSLSRQPAPLARLSERYSGFVEGARSAGALRIALAGSSSGQDVSDFAGMAARTDTFTGWVNTMKQSFRERTDAA